MKVVAYTRVSTEEQAREGVSLEAQKSKISSWANALDYEVIGSEVDSGISGKNIRARYGLQRALELACAEKAILVVYSLSRLSRSTKDTLVLAEILDAAGADLVSLSERIDTTTAAGKMVFRMLAVLCEFERDQISERTPVQFFSIRNLDSKFTPLLHMDTGKLGRSWLRIQKSKKLFQRFTAFTDRERASARLPSILTNIMYLQKGVDSGIPQRSITFFRTLYTSPEVSLKTLPVEFNSDFRRQFC